MDGKRFRIKPQGSERSTRIAFIVDSIHSPKEPQTLRVSWDGSDYDIESQGESSLTIPSNDQFGVVQLLQNEGEYNSFSIVFSAPLDKSQDLRGLIAVSGYEGDLRYTFSGNTLKLYADENFEKELTIGVFQGIRSQYGERMTHDYSGKLTFDPIKPEVRFVRNGTILPSSQNLKVNFQTINLRAVEVSVMVPITYAVWELPSLVRYYLSKPQERQPFPNGVPMPSIFPSSSLQSLGLSIASK